MLESELLVESWSKAKTADYRIVSLMKSRPCIFMHGAWFQSMGNPIKWIFLPYELEPVNT